MRESKFQLGEILGIGFTLVVLGVGIAIGLDVTADTQEGMCDAGNEGFVDGSCWSCVNSSFTPLLNSGGTPQCNATNEAGTNNGTAFHGSGGAVNSTMDMQTSISKLTEKLPTIATVIVASVIIGILVSYLWARFQ